SLLLNIGAFHRPISQPGDAARDGAPVAARVFRIARAQKRKRGNRCKKGNRIFAPNAPVSAGLLVFGEPVQPLFYGGFGSGIAAVLFEHALPDFGTALGEGMENGRLSL